ncbi:MAG: SWIM zinc finger family protein [Patescibacteria group bacterium]
MALNLTLETIKELTYPDYFQRGFDYYKEGRVKNYHEKVDELTATVVGTEEYPVRADLSSLEFSCECLAFHGETPCKHVVALLLTKVYGEPSAGKETHNTGRRREPKPEPDDEPISAKGQRPNRLASEESFDLIEKRIKGKIRSLDYGGDYWDYVENQEEFSEFVAGQIQPLPVSQASVVFLLELSSWLDKQLANHDDSDGILQDTLWQIICRSVRFLNQKGPAELKTFYNFTRNDSPFDLPSKIIEAILTEVDNSTVKTELVNKLEGFLDRDDPDFSFSPQTALWLLIDSLGPLDPAHFEKIALRFYRNDLHVRTALVEFYCQRHDYKKVLDIGWEERHNTHLEKNVLTAMDGLNQTEKLILFYQEKITDHLTKEDLRTLQELYRKDGKEEEWKNYLRRLGEKKVALTEKVDLCLFLKDYRSLADALLRSTGEFRGGPSLIEEYARKLTVLESDQAIRLYRFLFEKEAEKLKTSHHYPRIFERAEKLRSLGERVYLEDQLTKLRKMHPTHVKLRERIDGFLSSPAR